MKDKLETLQMTRVITVTMKDIGPDGKEVGTAVHLQKNLNIEALQDILSYHGEQGLKGILLMGLEDFCIEMGKKPFGKMGVEK